MRSLRGIALTVVVLVLSASQAALAADIVVNDSTAYATASAIGGQASIGDPSDVTGNSVTVAAGGTAVGDPSDSVNGGQFVIGGQSMGSGEVYNNHVTMNGGIVYFSEPAGVGLGTTGGTVIGGQGTGPLATGTVRDNTVVINYAHVDDEVFGGYSYGGNANNNTVTIHGGFIGKLPGGPGSVADTEASGDVIGGFSRGGNATNNTVTITRNSGGSTQIKGNVIGGIDDSSSSGVAENNKVYILDGIIGSNTFGGNISGGESHSLGGRTANNHVEITGGRIYGQIAGGYSFHGDAINNTVVLGESARVSATNTQIYGGLSSSINADVLTGNTLFLKGFNGSVNEINNFEKYNFHLPATLADGGTLITITGVATDLTGSTVDSITIDAASSLNTSHSVVLIDKVVAGSYASTTMRAAKGTTLLLDVTVEIDASNRLIAMFGSGSGPGGGGLGVGGAPATVNPQGKALSQSRIGGMTILGQGADLIADAAFDSALAGMPFNGSAAGGPAVFGVTSLSRQRVETGSHVDTDGWSLAAGMSWKGGQGPGCSGWLAGAFFEAGQGSYTGHNAFSTAPAVRSSGDLTSYGGGVMGRFRLPGGLRAEGSFRAGRLETDYRADGFVGGVVPSYDLNSAYVGAHAGLGYDREFAGCLKLDLSAKYLWTRQTGKTVSILGERTRFDSVDSQRIRAGGRVEYAGKTVRPYAGAHVEYEFDGKASAHNQVSNVRYDSPKTKGATFIGELGVRATPVRNLDIDLSVQGHAGRRDGVMGKLAIGWAF